MKESGSLVSSSLVLLAKSWLPPLSESDFEFSPEGPTGTSRATVRELIIRHSCADATSYVLLPERLKYNLLKLIN